MPDSLIDLAGLTVNAEDFLTAVLEAAAQPVWVVDPGGVIRFANPAALAALGFDDGEELSGRDSHETIHYQRPDGTPFPEADCPLLLPRTTGEAVESALDWFFRRDGSMFPVSYVSVPLEMAEGRGAVVAFTDIEQRLRAEHVLREHDAALAMQQTSLQRIATLVADGAASEDVFAGIATEVARLLGLATVVIWRYEPDGTASVLANWSDRLHGFKTGGRWSLDGPSAASLVQQTGRPVRIDDYANVHSTISDAVREAGMTSAAAAPIVVDGHVWGSIATGQIDHRRLPDHIEDQLAQFTELVATAIANADSRAKLTASRARIVAAADQTRRRLERDLHDGVQQRLVSLGFELRAVEAALPPDHELRAQLAHTTSGVYGALDDLVEIARGIHPAILSEGGLGPALKTLARRSAVPVELKLGSDRRLPEHVEVACYYVVSEALTNAAKHAHASVVDVEVNADDSTVQLAIRDDGVGGADLNQGSGLVGLGDRVEALGGRIEVASPTGRGTSLLVRIPIGGS